MCELGTDHPEESGAQSAQRSADEDEPFRSETVVGVEARGISYRRGACETFMQRPKGAGLTSIAHGADDEHGLDANKLDQCTYR